jgi:cytochrome c553
MFARIPEALTLLMLLTASGGATLAEQPPRDPGLRGGPPGAGQPLHGLTQIELEIFNEGVQRAIQLEAVCDDCADTVIGSFVDPLKANLITTTNSSGLGTRFNADQCTVCHNQPALGGSGGLVVPNPQDLPARYRPPENPMFDLIPHRKGATNRVPSFITRFGPIREVRFVRRADGRSDGGVHQLFTVVGRSDVFPASRPGNCTDAELPQPDFETEYRNGNLRFRIPLQLFGLGIIDGVQDREIMRRHQESAAVRGQLGIAGIANRSANNGTITRFGWKAQNKSIAIFAGEAYNVEMGITNDLFPQATDESPACTADKSEPNDITRLDADASRNQEFSNPLHEPPDWLMFAMFMRFLDAPKPAPFSASAVRGQSLFGISPATPGIGCVACHTATMVTPPMSETPALENVTAHLYSDLLVHHMGKRLADDITQGLATGDMFRTTPLWGVGQRRFFLHDGRTDDLLKSIEEHFSPGMNCEENESHAPGASCYGPSEANAVILRFRALSADDQQALLDFLRAL